VEALASGCSFGLLMLFLSCLIFKVGTLTEMPEVQEVMSNEQTSALDVPSLSLTILLFASAVFALVLSAALLVVQLALERARIAREASTSKARRLRKKDTGKEVEPPSSHPTHGTSSSATLGALARTRCVLSSRGYSR